MNIIDIFSNNYDAYNNLLDFPENKSALSGSNKLLHRLAQYAQEREECPKLDRLLRTMLDEPGISVTQKEKLQTLFFQLQDRIAPLSYGADAISIDEDFVDRIKRAIAAIVLDRAANSLPLPQKEALAYEIESAASAHEAFLKYFCGWDEVSAINVIDAFRPLPRHYLQCIFDLLDGHQPGIYSQKIIDLLSGIHQMLCKHGDMNVARLVYSKAHGLLCTWNTTIVYSYLGYMLAQQGDYDDALQIISEDYPPHVRRDFFRKVAIIASENGDFDRALRLLEAVYGEGAIEERTGELRMSTVKAIYCNAIARGQWDYAVCAIEFADDDYDEFADDDDKKDHLYLNCAGKVALSGDYGRAMDIAMYISDTPVKDQCCYDIILRAARHASTKEEEEDILKLLAKLDISKRYHIVAAIIHEVIDVSDDSGRETALYYVEKSPVAEENRQILWEALLQLFIEKNVHVDLIYDVWRHIPCTYAANCVQLITKCLAKKGDFASAMHFLEVSCPRHTLGIIKGFLQRACRHKRPNLGEAICIFLEKYGDVLFAIETFGRLNVALYYAKKRDVAKAVEIANDELSTLLEIAGTIARRDFIEAMSFIHSHFHSHLKDQCANMSFEVDGIPCALGDMIAHMLVQGFMHQGNKYFAQKVAYRIQSESMKQEALQKIIQDDTTSFFNPEFSYKEREIDALLNSFFPSKK